MSRLVRTLMIMNLCFVISSKSTTSTNPTIRNSSKEIIFLIVSQNNSYHSQLARQLKADIIGQTRTRAYRSILPHNVVDVHILHEFSHNAGDWTLLSMLGQLTRTPINEPGNSFTTDHTHYLIENSTKWIILCEEHTQVALVPLYQHLAKLNSTEPLFLGHTLYDSEPTIIHHFAFFENPRSFPYPMLRSGLILTYALVQRIVEVYTHSSTHKRANKDSYVNHKDHKRHCGQMHGLRTEFSIDPAHELALFIYANLEANMLSADESREEQRLPTRGGICKNDKKSTDVQVKTALMPSVDYDDKNNVKTNKTVSRHVKKIILQHTPFICGNNGATQPTVGDTSNQRQAATCVMHAKSLVTCPAVNREEIYFAIKTCKQFHTERIPIIEATWAPFVKHKRYFSDVEDKLIPTTNVNLPNVATGHCAKTLEILRLALADIEHWNSKLTMSKPIHWLFLSDDDTLLSIANVCEVIGCFATEKDVYLGERYGYRLHAADGFNYITGGGGIVFSLSVVRTILHHCTCPSASSPDDMIVGACLQALQINAIHSSRFHQARPNDYALEYLTMDPPVSFHKFWQLDPIAIYQRWFATADQELLKSRKLKSTKPRGSYKRSMSMPKLAKLLHLEKIHLDL